MRQSGWWKHPEISANRVQRTRPSCGLHQNQWRESTRRRHTKQADSMGDTCLVCLQRKRRKTGLPTSTRSHYDSVRPHHGERFFTMARMRRRVRLTRRERMRRRARLIRRAQMRRHTHMISLYRSRRLMAHRAHACATYMASSRTLAGS